MKEFGGLGKDIVFILAGRPKAHRALAGGGAIAEGHLPGENIRHATSRGSRTSV